VCVFLVSKRVRVFVCVCVCARVLGACLLRSVRLFSLCDGGFEYVSMLVRLRLLLLLAVLMYLHVLCVLE